MREKLQKREGKRLKFSGKFERFGSKTGWKGFPEITVLLRDIRDSNGKEVADHLWMNYTKGFQKLGELTQGDVIEFYARVKKYVKGYRGYREELQWERPTEIDYKLSHPTKFRRVKKRNQSSILNHV